MGDETKLQKLRRGQAAFARGDTLAASDVIAEDVDWGTTGTFPGTEVFYRGIEDLGEWMEDLLSAWDKLTILHRSGARAGRGRRGLAGSP